MLTTDSWQTQLHKLSKLSKCLRWSSSLTHLPYIIPLLSLKLSAACWHRPPTVCTDAYIFKNPPLQILSSTKHYANSLSMQLQQLSKEYFDISQHSTLSTVKVTISVTFDLPSNLWSANVVAADSLWRRRFARAPSEISTSLAVVHTSQN